MDLEKMQKVRDVLDRMLENERRVQSIAKVDDDVKVNAAVVELSGREFRGILDVRKKKLLEELRSLGMAHLAAPAPPAPSKSPVLDAAVDAGRAMREGAAARVEPQRAEPIGGTYDEARKLLNSTDDPCKDARISR